MKNNNFDKEEYLLPKENLIPLIEEYKGSAKLLEDEESICIANEFVKKFKEEEGGYIISDQTFFDFLNDYTNRILDKTLLDLVDKGIISMSWSEEAEEFTFQMTDLGLQIKEAMPEE